MHAKHIPTWKVRRFQFAALSVTLALVPSSNVFLLACGLKLHDGREMVISSFAYVVHSVVVMLIYLCMACSFYFYPVNDVPAARRAFIELR